MLGKFKDFPSDSPEKKGCEPTVPSQTNIAYLDSVVTTMKEVLQFSLYRHRFRRRF